MRSRVIRMGLKERVGEEGRVIEHEGKTQAT